MANSNQPQDKPQVTQDAAPDTASDVAPAAAAQDKPPVDNSMVVVDAPAMSAPEGDVAGDEPMQELPDSELPREIKPGVMGAERARLMQLIGLDVNHPFDEEAEDQIRRRAPEYDGTVTKAVWRELYKENPVSS